MKKIIIGLFIITFIIIYNYQTFMFNNIENAVNSIYLRNN